MATTASLLQWAANQGVVLDGVEPRSISGRGLGMVATRHINVRDEQLTFAINLLTISQDGDVVVTVPTSAIRSRHTLPKALMAKAATNMTLHGLLAADLLLHPQSSGVWGKLVPSLADFESSTPFFWPKMLQELLPREAKNLLRKQQTKFQQDWHHAKKVLPDLAEQEYLYSWFLVGTRSFYYEIEETLSYPSHDRLALLPVADMFNHASAGCSVAFSTEAYEITADRAYQAGEEVYTSYGTHSNDFLLAEYGFVLPDNPWDQLCLDKVLLAKLPPQHMTALSERDLLGDFMLRANLAPGDRTCVAMRGLASGGGVPEWDDWMHGREDADGTLAEARAMLPGFLAEFRGDVEDHRRRITELRDDANAAKMDVLLQRWNQLDELARAHGRGKQQSRGKDTKNKIR
ncbi:SET domain protein [Beauveria brongniartii RCEF 3172]|uniref:SET domain protein n=1 Tax=Beauveria brongniartii RCEF 3172 TaxID=1081107 RepID=A0A167JA31_9HYPO|nr:SET domain protein [Beauveria brongniartii RCEF 3172]